MVETLFNIGKLAPHSALFPIRLGRQSVPLQREFLGEEGGKLRLHHLTGQDIKHPRFKPRALHPGLIGTQATPMLVA